MRTCGPEIDVTAHQEVAGLGFAFYPRPHAAHARPAVVPGEVLVARPQETEPLQAGYLAVGIERVRHVKNTPVPEGGLEPLHQAFAPALRDAKAEKKAILRHLYGHRQVR